MFVHSTRWSELSGRNLFGMSDKTAAAIALIQLAGTATWALLCQ
jgi:hypothetical protein